MTNPIPGRWSRWRSALDVVATVLVITAAVVFLKTQLFPSAPASSNRRQVEVPSAPLSLEGTAIRGNPQAAAGVLIFTDFECPFCSMLATQTFPTLEVEFVSQGTAFLAVRHLPLPNHPLARGAASAAACAGDQGRFWEAHDLLFGKRGFDGDFLKGLGAAVGIDQAKFTTCLDKGGKARIDADVDEARRLGIRSTPVAMIGRRQPEGGLRVTEVILGAEPPERFSAALKQVLAGR